MKVAHINPDHYLETSEGRLWTPERSKQAWESAYTDFTSVLSKQPRLLTAYIVFGVQGSGKSTWIQHHCPPAPAIYFDAALPAARHRTRSIAIAQQYARQIIAVWIDTPLELALKRNIQRKADEIVPIDAINSVYGQLEPPSKQEGFDQILQINTTDQETVTNL
ncbi:hypothetical protein [Spongorhabdus nitratireducens]